MREVFEEGSISASFVRIEDQLADISTKALGRVRFQELRARIGMDRQTCIVQGLGGHLLLNPCALYLW